MIKTCDLYAIFFFLYIYWWITPRHRSIYRWRCWTWTLLLSNSHFVSLAPVSFSSSSCYAFFFSLFFFFTRPPYFILNVAISSFPTFFFIFSPIHILSKSLVLYLNHSIHAFTYVQLVNIVLLSIYACIYTFKYVLVVMCTRYRFSLVSHVKMN